MGYSTTFKGELKFKKELVGSQLAKVKSFFGEDTQEHQEWEVDEYSSYIDLRFNADFTGIEWDDETEKNSGMVSHVNLIITELKKDYPDFGLTGELLAQGEDMEDRWKLVIENDIAIEKKIEIKGKKCTCPNCEKDFFIEDED